MSYEQPFYNVKRKFTELISLIMLLATKIGYILYRLQELAHYLQGKSWAKAGHNKPFKIYVEVS